MTSETLSCPNIGHPKTALAVGIPVGELLTHMHSRTCTSWKWHSPVLLVMVLAGGHPLLQCCGMTGNWWHQDSRQPFQDHLSSWRPYCLRGSYARPLHCSLDLLVVSLWQSCLIKCRNTHYMLFKKQMTRQLHTSWYSHCGFLRIKMLLQNHYPISRLRIVRTRQLKRLMYRPCSKLPFIFFLSSPFSV